MSRPGIQPPRSLLSRVGRAIAEYAMIRDGDRILLGVSGGKDSLSLLAVLRHLRTYAPVRFALGVVTVDLQIPGFDPGPLTAYYDRLGVTWFYEQHPILEQARERMDGDSFCVYCARMKRGIMYGTCRREGYGVLALAQHLDDLAESLFWSFVFIKGNKVWVWIALSRETREVIAYACGDRSIDTCRILWDRIPSTYKKALVFTDYWEAYQAVIPDDQHHPVGKETGETAHVERWNNTLRQHLARFVHKTLSFSKCIIMHELCLKLFLHRYNTDLLPAS